MPEEGVLGDERRPAAGGSGERDGGRPGPPSIRAYAGVGAGGPGPPDSSVVGMARRSTSPSVTARSSTRSMGRARRSAATPARMNFSASTGRSGRPGREEPPWERLSIPVSLSPVSSWIIPRVQGQHRVGRSYDIPPDIWSVKLLDNPRGRSYHADIGRCFRFAHRQHASVTFASPRLVGWASATLAAHCLATLPGLGRSL